MVKKIYFCFLLVFLSVPLAADDHNSIIQGHAHNDYYQKRPLKDALDCCFCSVEVDVYLVNGKFLVGHDRSELRENITLESLYLDPLKERVKLGDGYVYVEKEALILLIDIKSEAEAAYYELRKLLKKYEDIISGTVQGKWRQGAVDIVISGNRAKEKISKDLDRSVGIDGRISDLGGKLPVNLMPLISDRWGSHFKWNGDGPFPVEEKKKLKQLVERAHSESRRIRFWATPDKKSVWKELQSSGVDLINTDNLKEFSDFIRSQK